MIEELIYQEDIIINVYAPKNEACKTHEVKTETKTISKILIIIFGFNFILRS